MASKRWILCVLALSIAGCGGAANHHSVAVPARVGPTLLAFEFPVNSVDFAKGQNVLRFAQAVEINGLDRCLRASHQPVLPPAPPISSANNTQFPDLAAISRSGFGDLIPIRQPPQPSQSSQAAVVQCASQNHDPTTQYTVPQLQPLMRTWLDVLGRVDQTPEYKAALQSSVACIQHSGVNAASLDDFFSVVQTQTFNLVLANRTSLPAAQTRGVQLGQIYARCMQSSEQVREQMRAAQRSSFFRQHQQAIRALESAYASAVEQASAQYGIAFPTA